jgi:hypothetical protein
MIVLTTPFDCRIINSKLLKMAKKTKKINNGGEAVKLLIGWKMANKTMLPERIRQRRAILYNIYQCIVKTTSRGTTAVNSPG